MNLDRIDWINRGQEEAIDPNRPIVDAHHHLWPRGGSTYLAPEFLEDAKRSHHITNSVFVECLAAYRDDGPRHLRPVGETEFVAQQAAALHGSELRLGAIVAFADLTLGPRVMEVIAAHERAANGLLRGVRHASAWDPSPEIRPAHTKPSSDLMRSEAFKEGVRTLGRGGYVFDAWVYHPQLHLLRDLAQSATETTIVVNHLGGPLRIGPYRHDAEAVSLWRRGIEQLSGQPNVVMKLGGIGMDHLFDLGWTGLEKPPDSMVVAKRWRDEICACIDAFGPDRCMFESNYPVDRQSLPYSVIWNAFQIIAEVFNEAEKDSLFRSTATRVYAIDRQEGR